MKLATLLTMALSSADAMPARMLPPMARRLSGGALELGISFGGALLLRDHVLDARYIPSESMTPTFEVGDLLLLDKLSLRGRPAERGDVVCFHPPPSLVALLPELGRGQLCCIKRVVAIAGDKVCVRRGRLFVNGRTPCEPYLAAERIGYRLRATRVPEGHVFVLGDNRNASYDSHVWGCLPVELLIGRPLCTYWPPRRARRRRAYSLPAASG
jgi:signal peptidase I